MRGAYNIEDPAMKQFRRVNLSGWRIHWALLNRYLLATLCRSGTQPSIQKFDILDAALHKSEAGAVLRSYSHTVVQHLLIVAGTVYDNAETLDH